MPLYEYRCEDCSNGFDVLTSYVEREKAHVCPKCESLKTRVLVSGFASLSDGLQVLGETGGAAATGGGGCCGGSCGCGN